MTIFDKYIGIPFKINSKGYDGVDCYTLIQLIFENEKKIKLPNISELCYELYWANKEFIENSMDEFFNNKFKSNFVELDLDKIKPFDLLIFSEKENSKLEQHIGVYIGKGNFIHAIEGKSVMVSKVDIWRKRIKTVLGVKDGKN